ncbi:class I SAM-dependent methyltransferase [Spirosoma sp. KCTC 42546]|uniref:class I SAM-dependent methyltransferase n=1 Tax=Spirosoma sp. KCTC 42546 TaxID=2520506 RepID=UPI0011595005|nr:class I SAM-dependent methyltransferase [Spirosoma sp. KCTC 42546]QDK83093.1 class I SAM-dependent methyltransferase [Spirosoma sp. KCTC 42546]
MKYAVKKLNNTCRVCQSSNLHKFLKLDDMPFTDDFLKKEAIGSEFLYPIEIYFCQDCHTVQTQHDVSVDEYYEDYQYSVGASLFASTFMQNMAKKLCATYYQNAQGLKVLEVGSGDGEQLVPFKELGCKVLGYEPSSYLVEVAASKGISSVQGLFTEEAIDTLPDDFKEVDIILLSYTFDHIPDPIGFLNGVKKILNKKTGILVIENHDLEKIFERQEYCLFEHEHSIYLTKNTAISLAKRNGFEIIEFDVLPENERRANSLIFVMSLAGSDFASKTIDSYPLADYTHTKFYDEEAAKIQQGIRNFEAYITKKTDEGKTIAGYGAGGRGVMTLAAVRNAGQLAYLVDKKPKQSGVFTPKSHIGVYEITHLSEQPVDEAIVFSFGYMSEIKQDLAKMGYADSSIVSMLDILKNNE